MTLRRDLEELKEEEEKFSQKWNVAIEKIPSNVAKKLALMMKLKI
jgi:hypothetical protein